MGGLFTSIKNVIFLCVFFIGSLCDSCTGQSYQLPVLDTVFVRSHWRRTGLALQMLEDFCSSQPSEAILGISFPVSPGMYGGIVYTNIQRFWVGKHSIIILKQ